MSGMPRPNIILTGFMATGKSTVGRLLADRLDYEFIDTDELIVKRSGQSVAGIFSTRGEAAFREMEAEIARELGVMQGLVISTGGGLMLDTENAAALSKSGRVFCLVATPEEIFQRVSKEKHVRRPLLEVSDPLARIVDLIQQRKEGYAKFYQFDTSNLTPEDIAQQIIALVKPNSVRVAEADRNSL